MKAQDNTLVAAFLMPNKLETSISGVKVMIENVSPYPYENTVHFQLHLSKATDLKIKIRKPGWVNAIKTNEAYTIDNDFIIIYRLFSTADEIKITFETEVQVKTDNQGDHYFSYGALLYAKPIESIEIAGKTYAGTLRDYYYQPVYKTKYAYSAGTPVRYEGHKLKTEMTDQSTGISTGVELVPMGKTILRQVTFPPVHTGL